MVPQYPTPSTCVAMMCSFDRNNFMSNLQDPGRPGMNSYKIGGISTLSSQHLVGDKSYELHREINFSPASWFTKSPQFHELVIFSSSCLMSSHRIMW